MPLIKFETIIKRILRNQVHRNGYRNGYGAGRTTKIVIIIATTIKPEDRLVRKGGVMSRIVASVTLISLGT